MKTKDCCLPEKKETLFPLYILLWSIFVLSITLSFIFPSNSLMMYLMGIWFLAFWVLKLPDLKGFVNSFSEYDIIAKNWRWYGYIYPFIEIILGLLYLLNTQMLFMLEINIVALMISLLWILSAYSIIKGGKKVLCACMGTYWKLPMTKVTILENGVMFGMILLMLLYPASMMDMRDMDMSGESDTMKEHCETMPEMTWCEQYR